MRTPDLLRDPRFFAVLLPALLGCGGGSDVKAPPPPPPASTAAPAPPAPAAEAPVSAAQRATQLVDHLASGKHADARKHFDDAMNKAIPSDQALADLWAGVEGKVGKYKRTIGVTEQAHGQHRVVLVTCEFEGAPMDVKVVLDPNGRIAGLFVSATQHPDAYGPRPQMPKPPFPYESRDVSYESPKEKATIAGTLALPSGTGPFPVVLLITGSGAQDRDETLFGHKPFLVISDHLVRAGIAVLRVDDRGVGKSSAENPQATIETHAVDVEAGIAFLKAQKELDPKRIGLVGHSEGGIIAAVVAARNQDVRFVVSLAGTGLPGSDINPMQVDAILRGKGGMSEDGIKEIVAAQRKLMGLIAKDADDATLKAALDEAIAAAKKHTPGAEKRAVEKAVEADLAPLKSAWFKSFVKLDPRAHWSKVKVPVLAMIGGKDTQVPADANLAAIDAALKKGKNQSFKLAKLAQLNHLFQPATTGLLDEYGKIETTFDANALDMMTQWLVQEAGVKRP